MDIVGEEEEEEEEEEEKALFHSVFFPIPSQFFLCIFLTREGRWFRPALKPLAGAHAWINGWRGQKSRSGLLEFSFGVNNLTLIFYFSICVGAHTYFYIRILAPTFL